MNGFIFYFKLSKETTNPEFEKMMVDYKISDFLCVKLAQDA